MSTLTLRKQLDQQLDMLPEDVLTIIADFAAFLVERRKHAVTISDWTETEWQQFALQHFFADAGDEVTYSLHDAQEVYHT